MAYDGRSGAAGTGGNRERRLPDGSDVAYKDGQSAGQVQARLGRLGKRAGGQPKSSQNRT